MARQLFCVPACIGLLALSACAEEGDGSRFANGTLRLLPLDAVLETAPNTSASLSYTLERYGEAGWEDVSVDATFLVTSEAHASFAGNVLTTEGRRRGFGQVTATFGEEILDTSVTILVISRTGADIMPPGVTDALGTEPSGAAVELAYPYNGVLLPPNFGSLELQWWPADYRHFKVTLVTSAVTFESYVSCTDDCGLVLDTPMTGELILGHAGSGEPALWSVRGVSDDGAVVGASDPAAIKITGQQVFGGIYYWQADPGVIMRKDYADTDAAQPFYDAASAGGLCVGCHALSRDGSRMAVGIDAPTPARLRVVDVPDANELLTSTGNFMAFSPDGATLLKTAGERLESVDVATGADLTDGPGAAKGTMPDWSPDGSAVVYIEGAGLPGLPGGIPGFEIEQPGIDSGDLMVLRLEASGWTAGTRLLTNPGANDYYPSFSPDSRWVLFNRSAAGNNSYEASDAKLWLAAAAGGRALELSRANGEANWMSSWPKFAPFEQRYQEERMVWITFSSYRPYGVHTYNGQQAQLWMAAVSLARAEQGVDPSYPAFRLPFQNLATGNHIAQWVDEIIGKEEQ